MIETIAGLLLIGLIAGIIAGLLGVGGGIIFTPVLFFLFTEEGVNDPVLWTIGTGLLCTCVASIGGSIRQKLQDNIFLHESLRVGILGSIGVFAGKLIIISPYYSDRIFVIVFVTLLVIVSVMMFMRGRDKNLEDERKYEDITYSKSFFVGGIGGLIASLAGVGGGGIMVPIMNLVYKQPFRKAVSISSLAIVLITFSGVVQLTAYEVNEVPISPYFWGYVDFGAAFPLVVAGLVGGFAGAHFNHRIGRKKLQWGFALLALAMAIRLVWTIV